MQPLRGADAGRRGGIAEPEQICAHVAGKLPGQLRIAPGRGEQPSQHRAQRAGELFGQSRALHDLEKGTVEDHRPGERERELHGALRALHRRRADRARRAGERAENDRHKKKDDPDVRHSHGDTSTGKNYQ